MYRPSTSKQLAIRLTITYSIMTIATILLVAIVVLFVQNYRYNVKTGELEQQTLVQYGSLPSGASVTVDEMRLNDKTATKSLVSPGRHTVSMSLDGYRPWTKTIDASASSLIWLDYARLVPNELPVESVRTYSKLADSLASPDRRQMLIQPVATSSTFRLVNLESKELTETAVTIPAAVLTQPAAGQTQSFTIQRWSTDSRHVLVLQTIGSKKQWIVFDTKDPAKSKSISKEFPDISLTEVYFAGSTGEYLYGLSGSILRKIDLKSGTISRALVQNVASFKLYGLDTLTYISKPNAKGVREIGFYRDGDDEAVIFRTIADKNAAVSFAISEYYHNEYIAVAIDEKLTLYKDSTDGTASSATELSTYTLPEAISSIEFNANGNHLFVKAGKTVADYSVEQQQLTSGALAGDVNAAALSWLDGLYVWDDTNGTLTIREIDGTNVHEIMPVAKNQTVTLSRNDQYLYSIGTTDEGFQLQRVKMIL